PAGVAASVETIPAPVLSDPASDAPRFPCGSARVAAAAAEGWRSAAVAAATTVDSPETNGGIRDRSATPVPARSATNPGSGEASPRHGLARDVAGDELQAARFAVPVPAPAGSRYCAARGTGTP